MTKEFEGKSEQEAIDKAVETLQLDREHFDVEVVDPGKRGLFKKSNVKIRIHVADAEAPKKQDPKNDFEEKVKNFLQELLKKMGYASDVQIAYRRETKIGFNIVSKDSGIIIGKKGKNLDAIQLLVNVYAGRLDDSKRIIVDTENYRIRHEEYLIRTAYKTAEQVKKTKKSKLLEPMNPFERRLIHSALNDVLGVETESEGEGLYKQVRITYKGMLC